MNIACEGSAMPKFAPLLPMSGNNRFYSCNVLYILPYDTSYILVFGCKIMKKKNIT